MTPAVAKRLQSALCGSEIRINRFLRPRWMCWIGGVLNVGSERYLTRFIYKVNAAARRPQRRRKIFGATPPGGWERWNARLTIYPRPGR